MELWGGVECTVNRVGDSYIEQLDRLGHTERLIDFDRFAELGIKALRFPLLWERTAPVDLDHADWGWSDASLHRLKILGIRPIVGLVHHGSGPLYTNLLDPEFPGKLATYARAVAERYPSVTDYTPVNEPLTTARFSGLYGHWYPHHRDSLSFVGALMTQCRGIVSAMKAIREINPKARLIQTEDLGTVFSTPKLHYQAEFENERRWCSFDLLCGRINRNHPMWSYLTWVGIPQDELTWFLDNPCPPAVIGVNHYLSSDRFLDENIGRYPHDTHGGNERDQYADVLAARVRNPAADEVEALLSEVWQRYSLPVAITECHNGCTREEQLRWFLDVWKQSQSAAANGADVVAVTAWSLLGAFDWNHLVTRANGDYEPGVFDIRSASPRPTAVAKLLKNLTSQSSVDHPVLQVPGWWKRPDRFVYGFSVNQLGQTSRPSDHNTNPDPEYVRPIVITGAAGTLGRAFTQLCGHRGIPVRAMTRAELDIADPQQIRRAIFQHRPWAVINAAGFVRVDEAERETDRCFRENTEGPSRLAEECAKHGIRLLTFSSDLVFDGNIARPYVESDPVSPLNCYGISKAEAEKCVTEMNRDSLIIRTSALFGPWDEYNFLTVGLRELSAGRILRAASDTVVSPTYVPDLVNACLDLLIDEESGIWHLANPGEISWADLIEKAASYSEVDLAFLRRCNLDQLSLPAIRPRYSALTSERGILLPPLDNALRRFADAIKSTIHRVVLAA